MTESILDRLANEVAGSVVGTCEACDVPESLCDYHAGFIDGTNALVAAIELELAKVGYVGP
jgi:hypothetical protein